MTFNVINNDIITVSDVFSFPVLQTNEANIQSCLEKMEKMKVEFFPVASNADYVGLEIEVEGIDEPRAEEAAPFWRIKEDGSLRNNGFEYVSFPLRGRAISAALWQLKHTLMNHNPNLDFSSRTSVHVHLNLREFPVEHVFNLVLLYLTFENLFYKFSGDCLEISRENNIFCVPVKKSPRFLPVTAAIRQLESGDKFKAIHTLVSGWKKYTGFNLLPLSVFGTIEFRHMGGTLNLAVLGCWINLILRLKCYASEIPFEELRQKIIDLNTNSQYEAFVREVFLSAGLTLLKYNLQTEMEEGVKTVKAYLSSQEQISHLITNSIDSPENQREFVQSSLYALLRANGCPEIDFESRAKFKKKLEAELEKVRAQLIEAKSAVSKTLDEYRSQQNNLQRLHDAGAVIREHLRLKSLGLGKKLTASAHKERYDMLSAQLAANEAELRVVQQAITDLAILYRNQERKRDEFINRISELKDALVV